MTSSPWIAYPKLTGAIVSDLTRDKGWDVVRDAGLRPVSLISPDGTWSVLRFRKVALVKSTRAGKTAGEPPYHPRHPVFLHDD